MLTTKDGRSIQIINRPLPDGGWLTTHEDVSERENLKRQLDAALNNMAQGWCLFDREQRLVMSNQPYAMLFGLDPQRIRPGMLLSEIINLRVEAGNSSAKMSDEQYRSWRSEIADAGMASDTVVELINGKIIEIHHRPMSDGGWVATHEDITDRRKFEARIAHLAHHDGLTGLANRVKFCETLQQALVRAQRQSSHVAVLYLDLDRFKEVNDTLGHAAGDAVLKATASRIQSCVRETDLVARLGGTNLQSSWSWFTPLQMPQLSLNALLKD